LADLAGSITQYLTHHYLIDLVAGGSLTCAFFYYFLSKMPDQLRHPTTKGMPATPYHSGNAIPLDEESGLPKTFAHTAAQNGSAKGQGNGHPDSYGGWEEDDDEEDSFDEDLGGGDIAGSGSRGGGKLRDSFDTPASGDIGGNSGSKRT